MEETTESERAGLINVLVEGTELAVQLSNHLVSSSPSSIEISKILIEKILSSFEKALQPMHETSSSIMGSNSNIQSYRYDVFISFRGPDTRNTFVDHLYAHLIRKGIFAFKDDKQLQKGESISPQLLQAIKESRVSIVVFSKDYAASTWCLDEMATIAECHKKLKQTVLPVFYDVDPSHVRNQNGVYQTVFDLHTTRFGHEPHKVARWKKDMAFFAGLTGWDVRDKPESEEIEKLVQKVIKTLGHKFSGDASDLIGIQPRVEALERLLKLNSEDDRSRVLGILGMDGIGKTTLAKVLYDKISSEFHARCFIENVSKIYKDGGAIAVQKQILRQTINEKNLEECSPSEISGMVRSRLHNIKLLVVLDDVDQFEQLQKLHIHPKLLHARSRIIITTRDVHILRQYRVDDDMIYEAELMNDNDARELLCTKAFKNDDSISTYAQLIPGVLKYTQGLPLAITTIGSFLQFRDAWQWRDTLDRLQSNLNSTIMDVLQISFEGLDPREREIFLHIACFFEGERKHYVMRILDACGLYPGVGISVIAERSLITLRNQEIHMHRMLQELGKQIVRGDHPDEPRFWNRLWLYQDFYRVMMTKREGIEVKAIVLHQKEDDFKFNELRAEDLPKMRDLKLLILNHKNFSGRSMFLSNSLRYLSWSGYPFTSLSSEFQPCDLVELNMPDSSIEQLWEGIQHLPFLKRLDLCNSQNLKKIPSFEGIPNLERLDLTGCIKLSEVHPSIGLLKELQFLSLQNCSSMVSLDFGWGTRLSSLRVLRLSGCTSLEKTPDFTGALNLEYLDMDRCTSLYTIHESIGALEKLRFLSLRDCTNLVRIPGTSFNKMKSLIFLDVSFCSISEVPEAIGELRSLERLNLQGNNFTTLPSSIERLYSLAYLNLSHCHRLESWPALPKESGPSDSVGRYFKTTSGSRDHRSGLYIFDCPAVAKNEAFNDFQFESLIRLVKEPRHFRCGFDFVLPWDGRNIPGWLNRRFNGSSVIRVVHSDMPVSWVGFVFYVAFEVNNCSAASGSSHHLLSSPLPYPFYLSFESEHTEECFDMPLRLELNKVDGSNYLWIIYISREHCHFVKTGAKITFKARQGVIMKEWGMHLLREGEIETPKSFISDERGSMLTEEQIIDKEIPAIMDKEIPKSLMSDERGSSFEPKIPAIGFVTVDVVIVNVEERGSSFEPKIQLPYNWLVSDEDEAENNEAKGKEINLFNLGLLTGRQQ